MPTWDISQYIPFLSLMPCHIGKPSLFQLFFDINLDDIHLTFPELELLCGPNPSFQRTAHGGR